MFVLVTPYQFRVHRYFFERESEYFQKKLAGPASPGELRQGGSESSAIILHDVTPDDFAKFLWVFYNPKYSIYKAPIDNWKVILRLAHQWKFPEVKALVIRELQKPNMLMSHIDRIVLYHDYEVNRNLLLPHYASLVERDAPLSLEEGLSLKMDTTINVYTARERIRSMSSPVKPEELYKIIMDLFRLDASAKESLINYPGAPPEDSPSSSTKSTSEKTSAPVPPIKTNGSSATITAESGNSNSSLGTTEANNNTSTFGASAVNSTTAALSEADKAGELSGRSSPAGNRGNRMFRAQGGKGAVNNNPAKP